MLPYLQQHFYDVLSEAYKVKHDVAVAQEIDALLPVFSSLSNTLDGESSVESLRNIFKKMAQQHGSLIRSGFAVTDSASFYDYAVNDCSKVNNGCYNGEDHCVYPPPNMLDDRQRIGFAQLLRVSSDTRITQPILTLNVHHIYPEDKEFLTSIVPDLEALYRLTTHDWLHHFTMPIVDNQQVVKTNRHDPLFDPLVNWVKTIEPKPEAYKHKAYEAWAVITQANLVKQDDVLMEQLEASIKTISEKLEQRLICLQSEDYRGDKALAHTELLSVAKAAIGALHYIEHPDKPVFDSFKIFLDRFTALNNQNDIKLAIKRVFGENSDHEVEGGAGLLNLITNADSVRHLFAYNEDVRRFQRSASTATKNLFPLLKAHYNL